MQWFPAFHISLRKEPSEVQNKLGLQCYTTRPFKPAVFNPYFLLYGHAVRQEHDLFLHMCRTARGANTLVPTRKYYRCRKWFAFDVILQTGEKL